MGDMADDLLDQFLFGRHDRGFFDEYPGGGGLHASPPRCKFCGSTDVYWIHTGARWRLYEATGAGPAPHVCVKQASLDDFDDESDD